MTRPDFNKFMNWIVASNPGEVVFHQAAREVFENVWPVIADKNHPDYNPLYWEKSVPYRLAVPEKVISFQVVWENDKRKPIVNRGWRVKFRQLTGPYKGGLRFHPTVNMGVLKFLGFEQVFKNALLTNLHLGGAKGGSDFDPKGKSDDEIRRFCNAFMRTLSQHIGKDIDVPAGDIGVGARELGYLFGAWNRHVPEWVGPGLTGKPLCCGGNALRPHATGYGLVIFVKQMLKHVGRQLTGKRIAISGSGNVAQYALERLLHYDAIPVTLSDSDGTIYAPNGFSQKHSEWLKELKNKRRGRVAEFTSDFNGMVYYKGEKPWKLARFDIALPCATQNEITKNDALALVDNGVQIVAEGANMPSTPEALNVFRNHGVIFAPSKAANAGGVAVSGLEMAEDKASVRWSFDECLAKLEDIMADVHIACLKYGTDPKTGSVDYVKGANIGGFLRVAEAMLAQGY